MTIQAHPRSALGQYAHIVADIARALESPHEAEARVRHVLDLIRGLVPCDRCALYRRSESDESGVIVVPEPLPGDRVQLAAFLQDILQFMEGAEGKPRPFDSRVHLALPVIGLDEILGVLLVDREHGDEYEPHHLQLISAVCSQLGAYLTMVRLHHETARQTTLLADREQQLRGTARFREEFIGVIGHDLRNPLSAIRTGMQLLTRRAPLDACDAAVADRVVASADRMSRMIEDLMDFARGRLGGGIPLRRSAVDLHALCRDVVEEAQTAYGRTVQLEVSGNTRGHWDSDRLAQLLSNLVGNALQHSSSDGTVTVTVRDEQDHARVEVHNAGAPIPDEHLEHIFEPFRRGDSAASAGLGLGLYIADRIVHAHGGTITVTSTQNEGTTFEVRLPRRRAGDRSGMDQR